MRGDYIATLDIGSSNVRVIVAEIENGKPHVAGIGSAVSRGMRKGAIIDIDHTVESIREAVDKAEQMVGIDISDVYVGISGDHISLQPSHGVVAVSGESREIGREDIERVLEASRMTALPPERTIIEVVPKQFIVDGLGGIRDPSRMIGVRLEVDAILVTGTKTIVHNVLRCVERASLTVSGFVLLPLAAGEYCLSPDEKNLGVVFADIGGGATSLAIFEHGHLVATAVVPIGGEYITNDIAYGLRTQKETAEQLKRKYGVASIQHASSDVTFPVSTIGNREKTISQVDLAHIIEPRVEEIFYLIRQQVESLGFSGEPAAGYVLTGGTVSIPHTLAVAQQSLGPAVRIATPTESGFKDPSFTGGVGMVHYLLRGPLNRQASGSEKSSRQKSQRGPSPLERMKKWLSEFI
ncbi:cell division protein FtsA [Planifilum fulgidum]|uniref:Cell division protein FtsA n=1 Tax=Planifilum fulgidum TaxID=201973 RepID=A0A1I2S5M3_9BACL|nr:cell division protein FtsA [Planifilum fulgidum]MBO2495674.1 cell division protein FtsA [Bacillota bacterium]MBO2532128.1 cell division protein FtsA [Thermoactinomycetaceae bacterium]SFG46137.1 cell division protein FtsA [Planifilum fulgidum]